MCLLRSMQISSELRENIRIVHGERGLEWLSQLPVLLENVCQKRELKFISPLPGLSYNFVAEVRDSLNRSLILKIGPQTVNLKAEAAWLKSFPETCPQVSEFDQADNFILMEKVAPGTTLKYLVDQGKDDEATRIVAGCIRSLQSRKMLSHEYKSLEDLISDYKTLEGVADSFLLEKARTLHRELCQNAEPQLLHGDLHHDNILADHKGWKVIDPHGYVGDPISEMGVLMYNPVDRISGMTPLKKLLERRFSILQEELGFDPQRMKAWAFCKTMISAAWFQEDSSEEARFQLGLAQLIDEIKI